MEMNKTNPNKSIVLFVRTIGIPCRIVDIKDIQRENGVGLVNCVIFS